MYKRLLLIILIYLAFSCNLNMPKTFEISSDLIVSENKYTAELPYSHKYENFQLHIYKKCSEFPHIRYERIDFKKHKNMLIAEFALDTFVYMATYYIADNNGINNDFNSIESIVYKPDTTLHYFSYFDFLLESNTDEYKNIFNQSRTNFPDEIGIYAIKWMYEGMNNITVKDSLASDLKYLKQNFQDNTDYHLIMTIGSKLMKNKKEFDYHFKELAKSHSKLFNFENTVNILNDVISSETKNFKEFSQKIIPLIKNNPYSHYTVKRISSVMNSPNDSIYVKLINKVINKYHYYYYDLLLSKYRILTFRFLPDSSETLAKIEKEFYDVYDNKLIKDNYGQIPNYKVFLEFNYHHNYRMEQFEDAVEICKLKINQHTKEKEYNLVPTQYCRIGDIYSKKMNNHDLAKFNYIKGYEIKSNNKKCENALKSYYDNYTGKLDFDKWVDSLKNINLENEKVAEKKLPVLISNTNIDLNNPKKDIIINFYSNTCSACNFILSDLDENSNLINETNIRIININLDTEDKKITKYKNLSKFDLKNKSEIINFFEINQVPVVVYINSSGEIVNIDNGAGPNWSLSDKLILF